LVETVPGKVQSLGHKLSNAVWAGLKTLSDGSRHCCMIDDLARSPKTIFGHFSATGKDDDGEPGEIKDGAFSGVPVSSQ
jgi:hypothetical protein